MAQTKFERELEIFRTEEETAQQYFFSYLSVRSLAAADPDVLQVININPLFWVTAHHAMLLSTFVALGRIFDQKSKHNIDALMSAASEELSSFSRTALVSRKQGDGLSQVAAEDYAKNSYELSPIDLRKLRKEIAIWRRIYQKCYREIRDKVFAHTAMSDLSEINNLLAKTNINEMETLFASLSALYSALWGAFYNGHQPLLNVRRFELPPRPHALGHPMLPGERVYREGHAVLKSMVSPIRIEEGG